ncbi:MAG: hypothetical protein CMF55_04010 [Legionellales bacterium]|nr:hypothetical protein [Legionellales bacterium]
MEFIGKNPGVELPMVMPNKNSIYECNIKTIDLLHRNEIITHKEKISLNNISGIEDTDITTVLIEQNHIEPEIIGEEISKYTSHTFVQTITKQISENIIKELPEELTYTQFILPISIEKQSLTVACYSLHQIQLIQTYSKINQKKISIIISTKNSIVTIINNFISQITYSKHMLDESKNNSKIIDLVNHLITDAIIKLSSDIHIHPDKQYIFIRLRIDGELTTITQISIVHLPSIISRLKILSNLDISETRRPQDGRFIFISRYGHHRDCRISICPSLYGEKSVIRLLNSHQSAMPIRDLNLSDSHYQIIATAIHKPQGLILITGPTGSGKTQTLYTLINTINDTRKNIITIENPIEITMEYIHQINIRNDINLTFHTALKSILRQDPDIIMIGEIRDKETATMAIQASQTGHLVFSTLHSNSSIESITRLINMGAEPYNLSSSLSLIIAQRLVKKICHHCNRKEHSMNKNHALIDNNIKQKNRLSHCHYCTNGYYGRTPVLEILSITDEVKNILLKSDPHETLHNYLNKYSIPTLWDSALDKVASHQTTLEEVQQTIPQSSDKKTLC